MSYFKTKQKQLVSSNIDELTVNRGVRDLIQMLKYEYEYVVTYCIIANSYDYR